MATGLSLRDKKILDLASAGKTAQEIAKKYDTSPEKIVREIDRLTSALDWLSASQEFVLLHHRLRELTANLGDAAKDSGFDPSQVKVYLDAIRATIEQVEKAEERVKGDLETVQAAYARELVGIVEKSFYVTLDRLEKRLPDMPRAELEAEFSDAIVWVSAEIDMREKDE